jgi:hypothetical protein
VYSAATPAMGSESHSLFTSRPDGSDVRQITIRRLVGLHGGWQCLDVVA